MKYFLIIFAVIASVGLYFYLDKEGPAVKTVGSVSVVESESSKSSYQDMYTNKKITHLELKSISDSPSNSKDDVDSYFSVDKDCYTDYAREIYEDMLYEQETRRWLSKRKYDLYYQNSHLKNYQNFNERSLKSMASNGDTRAMLRIGFNALISGDDLEAEKWYENMLLEGDFSGIDQLIVLYKMNIAEADNDFDVTAAKESLLNWVAFKRKVNGLELFNLTAEYESFLSKEHSTWAENKLANLNKDRASQGLQVIDIKPLPEEVDSVLKELKKFYLEQKSTPDSPCKYHM